MRSVMWGIGWALATLVALTAFMAWVLEGAR